MTRPGTAAGRLNPAPEKTAAEILQEGLCGHFGRPVRIVSIACRSLDAQSTHPIDRLRVRLDSGEQLSVIFKRPHADLASKWGRREELVYRRLLAGQRFGAPALYASTCEGADERCWLFLEDVGDESLCSADMEVWTDAVRWLARMHGTYQGREEELRALDCLAEHDAAYYYMLARNARRHIELAGDRRALARFDDLMARFDSVVAYLVRQPRTLVHGDIFPCNLIVQPGPRIRPIDWEEAAVGLAAWDLTRLLDGWGRDRPAFVAAYSAEFARHSHVPLDRRAFRLTLAHCEILNALMHLGWHAEDCHDPSFVHGLLREIAAARRRLEREVTDG
jgi:aminoglycoside phosphotransferase (APT) family kinase protein